MIMYGIFNTETLEQLTHTVHHIHNTTTSNERLFEGQISSLTIKSIYANAIGMQHYSINSLLYLTTIKHKYVPLYKDFMKQMCIYAADIRVLAKGYLPISLITPSKFKEILNDVRHATCKTNPDYELIIKLLHLYYDMKLVTFGIDKNRNLIVQFPVFIQPYTQQPLKLYQLEMVPVIDQNTQADSYMHLQINKPYIALNSETCKVSDSKN